MIDKMSVPEIKNYLNTLKLEEYENIIPSLEADKRSGVQNLAKALQKRIEKQKNEIQRLDNMMKFERQAYKQGIDYIAGVDEAGRGPLAGPVSAAAVILPKDCYIEGLNDSKKVSVKKREELYDIILNKAIAYKVSLVSNTIIDAVNIFNATKLAMKETIDGLGVRPELVLVDAVTIPEIDIPQRGIIKGDALSVSIAAASILAKVTRDRLMIEYNDKYPEYDFISHKGYGTEKHIEAIKKHGPCEIHRKSFLTNIMQ